MKNDDSCEHSISRHDDAGCMERYCACKVPQSRLIKDAPELTDKEKEALFFKRSKSTRIYLYIVIALFNSMAVFLGVLGDVFLRQQEHIFLTYVGVLIGINLYVFYLADQYADKTIHHILNKIDRLEKRLE